MLGVGASAKFTHAVKGEVAVGKIGEDSLFGKHILLA